MPEPWEIYASDVRPVSSGRIVLAEVLEALCHDSWFMNRADIREAFVGPEDEARAEGWRTEVRSSIARLSQLFMRGLVATSVRPIGGGEPSPLPPGHWEVDDFEARFATSSIDPARWWDPTAPGTHWILVDAAGWEAWFEDNRALAWLFKPPIPAPPPLDPEEGRTASTGETQTATAGPQPTAFLRLHEVTVRTGLSRSGLYERIAAGTFPRQRTNGGRSVVWLEAEIAAWQKARIVESENAGSSQRTDAPKSRSRGTAAPS